MLLCYVKANQEKAKRDYCGEGVVGGWPGLHQFAEGAQLGVGAQSESHAPCH